MKYTAKSLEADMPYLNAKLRAVGKINGLPPRAYFVVSQRNGYTTVDLANDTGVIMDNLTAGSPRQCYNDCLRHVVGMIPTEEV